MNQLAAFNDTISLAEQRGMPEHRGELGLAHLRSMYDQAVSSDFSDAKLGRWLGWAQCAVVASSIGVTLEDMKQINLRHSEIDTRDHKDNVLIAQIRLNEGDEAANAAAKLYGNTPA
ncbi:hypothetical protein JVX93_21705 [Mycolicibacterium boenickei]|nr:hypothetical protein JVX93_21705 [Mycolicibacterium boenickei]